VSGSPWADPSTPTEPGEPYTGPPTGGYGYPAPAHGPLAPPGYGYPPAPGYGYPYGYPYGYAGGYPYAYPSGHPAPWWPVAPQQPRRPGQVVTSAVLAFVQAGLVVLASLYVWFFASILDLAAQEPGVPSSIGGFASEVGVLAVVQLLSSALLVAGGVRALVRRSRPAWWLLIAAHGVQVLLTVYWAIRLTAFFDDVPGPDPSGVFVAFTLLFAAAPVVGLGLVVVGAGRRWFEDDAAANSAPA
jgi:hypothetical protein